MAGLMTAPMLVLEMALMGAMYPNRAWNVGIVAIGFVSMILLLSAVRTEALVGDEAFLKAMIPHHAGAILMCNESSISDPEIASLCKKIVKSQQEAITQMKKILQRLH